MHEYSLALEVISLATHEAEKNNASTIGEIVIEVGALSGVEAEAFEFAMGMLVQDSILKNAKVIIHRIPGKGKCTFCNLEFDMEHRMATCPDCKNFASVISGGQEFRVQSLVVE